MPYYEVVYEGGAHSIMCVETEEEMLEGVSEQHRRAMNGEKGGPAQDAPAERVVRVLEYDRHPNDFNLEQAVAADEAKSAFKDALAANTDADGAVDWTMLLADMRNVTNPTVPSGPHESNYKMEAVGEVDPKKWGGE